MKAMYGHRLIRELLGLLFLFCGLLMLLSLWSYDPGDPTFNLAVSKAKLPAVHNAAGLFGAYLSGFLVDSCGLGAFLWIIFFLAVGAGFVSRWVVIKWYRWIGYLLLFACSVTFASAADIVWHGIHGGGLLGTYLSASSYVFFSPVGSILVWGFIFLIAMELSFSISWLNILCALAAAVYRLVPEIDTAGSSRSDFLEKLNKIKNLRIPLPRRPSAEEEPAAPEFDIVREARGMPSQDAPAPEETLSIRTSSESASEENGDDRDAFSILDIIDDPAAPQAPGSLPPAAPSDEDGLQDPPAHLLLDLDAPSLPADPVSVPPREDGGLSLSAEDGGPDIRFSEASDAAESSPYEPIRMDGDFGESSLSAPAAHEAEEPAGHTGQLPGTEIRAEDLPSPDLITDDDILPKEDAVTACPQAACAEPAQHPGMPDAPGSASDPAVMNPDGVPSVHPETDSPRDAADALPRAGISDAGRTDGSADGPAENDLRDLAMAVSDAMARRAELEASSSEPAPLRAEPAPKPMLKPRRQYTMPDTGLLDALPGEEELGRPDRAVLLRQGEAVITCLKNFNVHAGLARITPGPVVTMFEVRPAPGVKATRITNLANDLAMSLKAVAVRMQAPVPGTDTVGIEVPNEKRQTVHFREIIEHESFTGAGSLLNIALGKDISGIPVSADLAKMPHLLVAGATGKGKSVCLNSILISLLFRARPDEMKLILVDPKRVEFSMYADLPHLVHPVVTDMDFTKNALLWAVEEMMRRLDVFAKAKVRNITGYNERIRELRAGVEAGGPFPRDENGFELDLEPMPFLVIVIDELADLMQMKRKEVEGPIIRLAQMGRAAGLHLIIATQRPSVDVVTGLIKANFPCRIAFQVTNGQDSRTILDTVGAEKLLGMGDMLFKPNGDNIRRLHGAFVSDHDVAEVVGFWKRQQKPDYQVDFSKFGDEEEEEAPEVLDAAHARGGDIADDPLYAEATQFVYETGKVSISLLQRRFRIGFNRAARFYEQMEKDGIVGQADGGGAKPRSVIHR